MRWLALFLLAGCAMPFKYHVYQLPAGQADVIWVYHAGLLHRCWQRDAAPVCVAAHYLEPPPPAAAPKPQAAVPTPAKRVRVVEEPTSGIDYTTKPTD